MGRRRLITRERFEKAAENTGGIVLQIARNLRLHRHTVSKYIENNREFCDPILNQEKEKMLDIGEGSLFSQVQDKQSWAIKYFLSTKGKDRGYIERSEVQSETTLHGGISLTFEAADNYPGFEKTPDDLSAENKEGTDK